VEEIARRKKPHHFLIGERECLIPKGNKNLCICQLKYNGSWWLRSFSWKQRVQEVWTIWSVRKRKRTDERYVGLEFQHIPAKESDNFTKGFMEFRKPENVQELQRFICACIG
jgi:hypothetical protein